MAAQSFAMGEAFGKGFQSGKRRISSLTNEQFNSKTQPQIFAETTADISAMIPSMKKQMTEFTFLQSDIIQELIGYIKKLPQDIQQGLTNQPNSDPNADFLHSLGLGASGSSGSFESGDFAKQTSENIKLQIQLENAKQKTIDTMNLKQFELLQTKTQGVNTNTQVTNQKIIVPTSVTTSTSANPNVGKTTYDSNTGITTVYNNQGKIISQNIDPDKAPTATSTKEQEIKQTFTKIVPQMKQSVPNSQKTQYYKYQQQLLSYNILKSKTRDAKLKLIYRNAQTKVWGLMIQLLEKYVFPKGTRTFRVDGTQLGQYGTAK